MTRYAQGYTGPMLPAAGPRGLGLGGGGGGGKGGGATGGIQTAHQGLNQISEAVSQINNATGGGGGDDRLPSGGGDFGDGNPGSDYGGVRSTSQNLKNLGLKKGGKVPSASKRGDGIVTKGRTKGRFV